MHLHHSLRGSLQEGPQLLSFGESGICSLIHLVLTSWHEHVCDKDTKIRFILVQAACLWSTCYCRPTWETHSSALQYGLVTGLNYTPQQALQQLSDEDLLRISTPVYHLYVKVRLKSHLSHSQVITEV